MLILLLVLYDVPKTLGFLDDDGVFLLEKPRGDDFKDFFGDFVGDLSDVSTCSALLNLKDLFFFIFLFSGRDVSANISRDFIFSFSSCIFFVGRGRFN